MITALGFNSMFRTSVSLLSHVDVTKVSRNATQARQENDMYKLYEGLHRTYWDLSGITVSIYQSAVSLEEQGGRDVNKRALLHCYGLHRNADNLASRSRLDWREVDLSSQIALEWTPSPLPLPSFYSYLPLPPKSLTFLDPLIPHLAT